MTAAVLRRGGAPAAAWRPEVGTGYAPAHHGELLQGMFEDGAGQRRRALVTLPYPGRGSRAVFHPSARHFGVVGTPELTKVRRAAILTLREFTGQHSAAKGGQVEISSDVPRGIGMGSSTADVTATIRAVADYHGATLSREEVGHLAVLAERASDSIMIDDRVVLFAHREGTVLETLGHELPPIIVAGFDTDPGTGVDTLALHPACYTDDEVAAFGVLRAALRRAVAAQDVALLGRVATASARINQRFLRKPGLAALTAACRELGGAGVQVAHSGTVAGVIFDARRAGAEESARRCLERAAALGMTATGLVAAPAGVTERRAGAPPTGSVLVGGLPGSAGPPGLPGLAGPAGPAAAGGPR